MSADAPAVVPGPDDDVIRRAEPWTHLCGSCDAGLTMNCTCPDGDPRIVISDLVARLAAVQADLDAKTADDARSAAERGGFQRLLTERAIEIERLKAAVNDLQNQRLRLIAERDEAREDAIAYRNRADELHAERDTALTEVIALRAERDAAQLFSIGCSVKNQELNEALASVETLCKEYEGSLYSTRRVVVALRAVLAGDSTDE